MLTHIRGGTIQFVWLSSMIILIQFAFYTHMVPTGLGPWKMEPSDQDLTRFLRVNKQKLSRRPVATVLASSTFNQIGADAIEIDSNSKLEQSAITNGSTYYHAVTKQKGKVPKKVVFVDKPGTSESPSHVESVSSYESGVTTNSFHYDFLLEGLLTEWRNRREQLFEGDTTVKSSNQSFFPQSHKQIKYWAWPFLGIVALTSSLPLVRSAKQPVSSTPQLFQVEVDSENLEPPNESGALLFDKLAYTPNEASQGNKIFDQTLSLGLATNELDVWKNSMSEMQHPMANFDYSKMVLDLLVKKTHCHSFKAKPGYVANLAFTTSESESYYPIHPKNEPSKNVFPSVFKLLRFKEDVHYGRTFMLPYISARENWGRPFDPVYYRVFTERLIYRYLHQRLSIEAGLYRRQRKSVQFASRPVDETLRLEASFKELNLLKQIATPLQVKKVSIKHKAKVNAKAWKSAMDSKQWLSRLVLNADQINEHILSKPQTSSGNDIPQTVSLLPKDWPTLPNQFTRISKGSINNTELDSSSFLKPLKAAVHPLERAIELSNSTVITETVQDLFPEIRDLSHFGHRLSNRLSDQLTTWLTNWSLMYSMSEGVINDATFSKQFSNAIGQSSSQKPYLVRPELHQNTQYQSLDRTDSANRSEFSEQLFRAYLTYKNEGTIPEAIPPVSPEFTRMLGRAQEPLTFKYTFPSTPKKFKKVSHPTTGALLKTFVFRSPSYFEDPEFEDKRADLKRRRSSRYSRVSIALKKRKRIFPRPQWLRSSLYTPFIKARHPGTLSKNRKLTVTTQKASQLRANLNLKTALTPKYVSSGTPSLFRQKGLHHSLMHNLPQLTSRKFFRVAKWAEPKSKLNGWRSFFFANEFAPYTKALNANFKKLKQDHVETRLKYKLRDMPHWFWKGSHSSTDIESLRFKQGFADLPFTAPFNFLEAGHSESTMSHFFLNELKLVAAQNQSIYNRLNQNIMLQRDKNRFMKATRPELPGISRSRRLKSKNWVWPEGLTNVILSPLSRIESQWFLKQAHLLRDPASNEIYNLWQTGKIRKLTTPVRESKQQSIFRLRLPFVNPNKVHPVTISRSWDKVNVMDNKLNAFGLVNNRAHFYPQQLKLRLQNDRGANPSPNLRLTSQELEMQRNINHSIRFWWSETEQNLIPLMNPAGTQPWNLFEGLGATPKLTSETQSLTVNLVNGSLVLLHIALLSFLIQLPEARTFLKFYALVFNRMARGYLWATYMCYYLMQECVYEIQYAIFCGRTLMFPLVKHHKLLSRGMLWKQLHRVEDNAKIEGTTAYRPLRFIRRETVGSLVQKNLTTLSMMELCLSYAETLRQKEELALMRLQQERALLEQQAQEERALLAQKAKEERKLLLKRKQEELERLFLASSADSGDDIAEKPRDGTGNGFGLLSSNGNGVGPPKGDGNGTRPPKGDGPKFGPSKGDGNGAHPPKVGANGAGTGNEVVLGQQTKLVSPEKSNLQDQRTKRKKKKVKEYKKTETSLYYLQLAQDYYATFVNRENRIKLLAPEMTRKLWWSYGATSDVSSTLADHTDELSLRLMNAEEAWTAWIYETLYMKERHKIYKTALAKASLPETHLYRVALENRLVLIEALKFKLYKVVAGFTAGMIGLYFLISRKAYRLYYTVDKGIDITRRLTLQFMEEPGENAMNALNDYFFIDFMSDLLTSRPDESERLQTIFIEFYTRQANALGPVGSLVQRRLHRLAEDFYIAWTRPDKDLFMRHQKSLIFWNMWGALLMRAVARYKLSLADLLATKEEQEKLVECLITESDWSWTQQSLIQFQPLFDLFRLGKRSWKDFMVSTASRELGDPPMLEAVLQPHAQSQEAIQRNLTMLQKFEGLNLADALYTDSHAATMDELSWRWGAQQFNIYHSRLSTLGVEYHPPGNLATVPQLKHYTSMHTQLGWVIQDNLRTTFVNTPSKNALIVGPPGPEVTSLVRALVGELEMKFITDNARRYTTVIRNVAIGVRHLKEVFYSVSVEAPCLFVLEDIHLVGRRRDLLIAEDEELYLMEPTQVTAQNEDYEEDWSIAKYQKHSQLHYEKPFRGDYSFLISTNCFAFDYFKEPPPSRLRRFGVFTKSPYRLQGIEQELIKLRGLENLSNAEAKAPALSLTSMMQARKPIKEVKAAPNSPLTVAIEKNKKAFRPRRVVKNMPLQGISWDMWMLLSRYDYSIRSKVALLAVLTEDAMGDLTDMITDLLVMMDTVRATRGLIMFATTHAPTSLDPALRRPGRLDETLSVPLFSSVTTRWEILNLRYGDSDPVHELMPYAHVTRNLSNSEVNQLALKSIAAVLPKNVSLRQSNEQATSPFKSLQAKMHMSYFEAFFQSKSFERLKGELDDMAETPSHSLALDIQMRQRKFQAKVNTLTYTLVGAQLIRWKAEVVTDEMDADILAYTVEKVHPMLRRLERQNEYLDLEVARMRDPTTVREHLTNSLAPRFAETFFTSSLLNSTSVGSPDKDLVVSQVTFQLREKTNYVPLTFEKFELAAERFKPGASSVFTSFFPSFRNSLVNLGVPASRTSNFISTVIQKRSIWTKNLVVYRLLYLPNNQDYRETQALPIYDLLDPYRNYETLQKEQRVLYCPGNLTMNEKIELHKTYRLYLAVANRTIADWHSEQYKSEELDLLRRHVLPSLEELSSLALVMNHPTGTNKFYRQNTHLRQRFHLIDQWWNGHLEDLDVERTLQSEVETRTFFEESIGNDIEIDYPLPDKYYNVRSRRWVWKQTAESWFLKGSKFNDAAAYHYMVCALTRCYEELHKNRESLDHLAYTFLKSGQVSEVQNYSHYTRFYQTDV